MIKNDLKAHEQADIEAVVVRALERKPEVVVPEDFAVRVARSLPTRETSRVEMRAVFGRAAGYLAVVAMTVVLAILSRMHPEAFEAGRGFVFAVEVLLVAQLLAVGLWLGMRSDEFK